MALKDWKKIEKDYWSNPKAKESLFSSIKIKSANVPTSFIGNASRKEYKISFGKTYHDNSFTENYTKYFKTKSQALKFAKAYMRKH